MEKKSNGMIPWKYVDFISGFCSGLFTSIVCAPLDITRTRLNLARTSWDQEAQFFNMMKSIYKNHGFWGYYDGFSATVIGVPMFQFFFFGVYYNMKPFINENFSWLGNKKFSCDVIASLITGSFCQILTNPIWVVRVRMQADILHQTTEKRKYKTLFQSCTKIMKEEGINGFYKGTIASLMGVSHVMVNMPIYDLICRKFKEYRNTEDLKFLDIVIASNIAKSMACILTYPHIVIRSRQQDFQEYIHQDNYYKDRVNKHTISIRETIWNTYKNEGIKGFYGGLSADLVKVLPTNTILMLTFEFIRQKMGQDYH